MEHTFSVYILASRSRSLYTGVTNDLERRMTEHRQGVIPGFTTRYRVFRLVHVELFAHINDAIAREKEIKGWRREKKIHLIEQGNPVWEDLAARLPHAYKSQKLQSRSLTRSADPDERIRDDNSKDGADGIAHHTAHGNPDSKSDRKADSKAPMSFRTKLGICFSLRLS
ncbi:MAG: GIY-YIG nuclease family protein [Acidobacteriia bacterium]|nr:GIY-YIG nuclease family protein [Terriglobia bacterium]